MRPVAVAVAVFGGHRVHVNEIDGIPTNVHDHAGRPEVLRVYYEIFSHDDRQSPGIPLMQNADSYDLEVDYHPSHQELDRMDASQGFLELALKLVVLEGQID